MTFPRKTVRIALVASFVLAATAAYCWSYPIHLAAVKLGGGLPWVSWSQIGTFLGDHETPPASYERGFATVLDRGDRHSACSTTWSTPVGTLYARIIDEWSLELVLREQLLDSIYQHDEVVIRPGDVVVDVGAHLGTFALYALKKEAGHVVMLEPEPKNIACLEQTFARQIEAGRVSLVKAAAWHTPGVLHFAGDGLVGHVDEQGPLEVRAVRIDDLLSELGLSRIDFIKMDIEGAEPDALRGAEESLKRDKPRLALSIYHQPEHAEQLPAQAREARPDYQVKKVREFAYLF